MLHREQVEQLFDFVDIDSSDEIEYKEFLVALTTGHVLGTISEGEGFDDKAKITLTNGMQTTNAEIKNVLNLIVSAYLLFDPKGNGFIERHSVGGLIDEGGVDSNAMLSKERWDEMVRFFIVCTFIPLSPIVCISVCISVTCLSVFNYIRRVFMTTMLAVRIGTQMELLILRSLCLHSPVGSTLTMRIKSVSRSGRTPIERSTLNLWIRITDDA